MSLISRVLIVAAASLAVAAGSPGSAHASKGVVRLDRDATSTAERRTAAMRAGNHLVWLDFRRVRAIPVSGGRARTIFDVPLVGSVSGELTVDRNRIVVSAQESGGRPDLGEYRFGQWFGRVGRPFVAVSDGGFGFPAAGGLLSVVERLSGPVGTGVAERALLYRAGAPPRELPGLPNVLSVLAYDITGRYLAWEYEPNVFVYDLRAGRRVTKMRVKGRRQLVGVDADGALVQRTTRELFVTPVGGARTARARFTGVAGSARDVRGARVGGGRLAITLAKRVGVFDRSGRLRFLTPPSVTAKDASLDERGGLTWIANGCVFYAARGDVSSDVLPPGHCPRSEARLLTYRASDRRASVRVQCLSAPGGVCRGRIETIATADYPHTEPGPRHRRSYPFVARVGHHYQRRIRMPPCCPYVFVRATTRDPSGRAAMVHEEVPDITGAWFPNDGTH